MENLFKQELFTSAVKDKIYSEMLIRKKRIGVREFAKEINISASTLNRVEHGNMPDLETFFRLCKWMKRSTNEFYNH